MIFKIPKQKKIQIGNSLFLILLTTTLLLTGCTGTNKSKAVYKLTNVQAALATAKENKAHDYAPQALDEAEEKLRSAEIAIANKNHNKAVALLEEALLGAKYAEAKSEAARSKQRVAQSREMIKTLRHEMLLSR